MPPKRRAVTTVESLTKVAATAAHEAPPPPAAAGSGSSKEAPRDLFAGVSFGVLQDPIGGMTRKAFTKLIRDHGGNVMSPSANWRYGLTDSIEAAIPSRWILHSNFILASIAAGELQQEAAHALSPMDPITGLPTIGFRWKGTDLEGLMASASEANRALLRVFKPTSDEVLFSTCGEPTQLVVSMEIKHKNGGGSGSRWMEVSYADIAAAEQPMPPIPPSVWMLLQASSRAYVARASSTLSVMLDRLENPFPDKWVTIQCSIKPVRDPPLPYPSNLPQRDISLAQLASEAYPLVATKGRLPPGPYELIVMVHHNSISEQSKVPVLVLQADQEQRVLAKVAVVSEGDAWPKLSLTLTPLTPN